MEKSAALTVTKIVPDEEDEIVVADSLEPTLENLEERIGEFEERIGECEEELTVRDNEIVEIWQQLRSTQETLHRTKLALKRYVSDYSQNFCKRCKRENEKTTPELLSCRRCIELAPKVELQNPPVTEFDKNKVNVKGTPKQYTQTKIVVTKNI